MSKPTVTGIHLCGTVMRRAALRRSARHTTVATSEETLPETSPTGPGVNPVAVGAEQDDSTTIASIPASSTMSRCWTFPEADDARFRQMVAHRLEADLPVSIEELSWDYRKGDRPVDAQEIGAPERSQFIFAQAARTQHVSQALSRLAAAGVAVDVLTTEAEAIAALYRRGLDGTASESNEALVLATSDEWLVAVVGGGVAHPLRRIHLVPGGLEVACRQCAESIEAQVPRHELRRVWWCAGPAEDSAREALAEQLGVSVEPVTPTVGLTGPDGEPITGEQLARFGPAIGLALAGQSEADRIIRLAGSEQVRLGPRRERWERLLSHPWRWMAVAAGLTILAAAVHVGAIGCETRRMRSVLAELEQEGSPMDPLQPQIQAMQRLKTYRIDVEAVMADLCRPIPQSMLISSIRFTRDRRLVIQGTTKKSKSVFELADALRKSDRLTAVNPERTEPAQGGGFTISAQLVGTKKLPSLTGEGQRPWR